MTLTDSLLASFTVPFEHGLLVVEDSATSATHDSWDAATEPVHVDDDSIYLAVQASVDGPVTVEVHDSEISDAGLTEMTLRFSGDVRVDSRELKVSDSDNLAVLSLRTKDGHVRLEVFVDDDVWPGRVLVVLDRAE